jgi:hypothetical protein
MMVRKFWVISVLTLVAACSPFVTTTPQPSPQPIQVSYSPTLRPWVEVLNQCASENPEIALITLETSVSDPEFMRGDLALWFGEPLQGITGYAAALGEDEIIIIAGSSVGLKRLDAAQIKALYTENDPLYHTWTYGDGNELRAIFDAAMPGGFPPSAYAQVAPHPAAMLEAIKSDSLAIGYVPASWLTGQVDTIHSDEELQAVWKYPILALADGEPQGGLKNYLVCLQNTQP